MQGGVLVFHTRAVTWGLVFSCVVQFSACVVVKSIYLFKNVTVYVLETAEDRIFNSKFSPTRKTTKFFSPILLEGNVSTLSTFKVVREKSLRIIKAQISPRWGVEIKADSIVRFYESLIFTAKFNHDEVLN